MLSIKRFLILVLVICLADKSFSQRKLVPNLVTFDEAPYHFGFLLGINQMLFTVKVAPDLQNTLYDNIKYPNTIPDENSDSAYVYSIESTPTYGFVIGIVSNLRVGRYFDLRFTPSLSFGDRNLHYTLKNYYSGGSQLLYSTKNIQSTMVEFPLWMKFKGARIQNVRPYILAGTKYTLDLASNAKKKENSTVAHVFVDRSDIYALGGVGFDFYTVQFKFSTEISMSYGLLDVLKHDATVYTKSIDRINSKIFQISFTFE